MTLEMFTGLQHLDYLTVTLLNRVFDNDITEQIIL